MLGTWNWKTIADLGLYATASQLCTILFSPIWEWIVFPSVIVPPAFRDAGLFTSHQREAVKKTSYMLCKILCLGHNLESGKVLCNGRYIRTSASLHLVTNDFNQMRNTWNQMRHVLNKPPIKAYFYVLVMFLGVEYSRIVAIKMVNRQSRQQESSSISQDHIA